MAAVVSFTDQKPNKRSRGGSLGKLIGTWLSHTDGVATISGIPFNGTIRRIVSNPGSAAPSANWDFTITDDDSLDLAAGLGANRHTSNTEEFVPLKGDGTVTESPVAAVGLISINVTNAGSGKDGVITVYYE